MFAIIKLSLLFTLANHAFAISLLPEAKELVLDRFNGTCAGPNLPMLGTYGIIRKSDAKIIYFNATVDIKEDILGKPLFNMQGYRCTSKENLDTCELFLEYKGLSYCQLIDPIGKGVSPFYVNFVPELTCPLKMNVYKAYNNKLDTSTLVVFPLGNYYWRAKSQIVEEKSKRQLMCFEADLHSRPTSH